MHNTSKDHIEYAPTIDPTSSTTIAWTTAIDAVYGDGQGNDVCTPYTSTNSGISACDYVKYFADACEGGGYLQWTEYVVCADSDAMKYFLITVGVFFLFVLFVAMSTAADDFFCPSISAIVNHLKISQSVAGITFMAFGNGAPDIFSTLASVLNTKHPKAGLAIGDLLGGGCFVTTVVLATVIIVKPFKTARRPTLRDILFYLVGIAWMAFIMLYDQKLYVWQPAAYLALYLLYVSTVIFGRIYRRVERKKSRYHRKIEVALSNHSRASELRADNLSLSSLHTDNGINLNTLRPPSLSISSLHGVFPERRDSFQEAFEANPRASPSPSGRSQFTFNSPLPIMMEPMPAATGHNSNFVIPHIVISPVDSIDGHVETFTYHNGRFQYEEKDTDSDEYDPGLVIVAPPSPRHSGRRYTIMSLSDARSRKASSVVPDQLSVFVPNQEPLTLKIMWRDLVRAINLIDDDFAQSSAISKMFQIIKIPVLFLLRVTIPQSELWFKPLTILQCLTMPITVVSAFSFTGATPIPGGPGLWLYLTPVSAVAVILVATKTSYSRMPKYYKNVAAYVGFLMSVCWIYAISSEVVNIISMISVVSQISHEILGLTVMAWSNSIGDLVADVSVAKQGFPQMAASAAIGGPLFNLLVGFGTSFFIATVAGKEVDLSIDAVKALMLILLAVSLISTQIILAVNKFSAKRIHGFFLIGLYLIFLCLLILVELRVVDIPIGT